MTDRVHLLANLTKNILSVEIIRYLRGCNCELCLVQSSRLGCGGEGVDVLACRRHSRGCLELLIRTKCMDRLFDDSEWVVECEFTV